MSSSPATFLATVALDRRVVARYRIPGGFTDALGYLRRRDSMTCVIETRRGEVTVTLADVVAAKAVPEPPARRPPRANPEP
ncbi:MAG: ferrous iron transport protein A [Nakamurella sp.]